MTTLAEIAEASGFCRLGGDSDSRVGTVLLIHGLGESSACFEPLLESPLLRDWSLLAPDLPGYGQTPLERPFRIEDYARLLAEWMQAAGATPVVVIGHSMGGVIGQILSELLPGAVQVLLNVEGNLSPEDCIYSALAAAASEAEFQRTGFERLLKQVAEAGLKDRAAAAYARRMQACEVAQYYLNSLELVELSATGALANRMARLAIPTLYLAGLRGRPDPSRSLQLLEENQISWVGFQASGHWPFIDEPLRFQLLLADLLRGL